MPCAPRSPPGWTGVAERAAPRHPGLILGVARFFYDPRGSMRGMLDSGPTEARLLFYALLAAAILLTGKIAGILQFSEPGTDVMGLISAQAVSLLFFMPLIYYALAAVGTLVARLFRGEGSWHQGRAAFFWASLVSAPVIAFANHLARSIPALPYEIAILLGQFGGVFFAWALAQCYAEAFRFTRTWLVFAAICAPVFVLIVITWAVLNS